MKKLGMFWLVLLAVAMLTGAALADDRNPVVFYQGNTVVDAGDMISIRGEYLDQEWTATVSDGRQTKSVYLLQQEKQSFKFVIPKGMADGLYTLQLEGEKPLTVVLNVPVVRWTQSDEGKITTPNGWIRVQGECLRVVDDAPITLTLKGENGQETVLTPERVYDDYSVGFAVKELPMGTYTATYSNGLAECDAGTITVGESPMAKYPKDVFNVVEFGLDNTGVEDCTAKLRALMMKVEKNGGGVVYFPRGRYRLKGTFSIPKGVVMKGDGMDYTQIFWEDVWQSFGFDENGKVVQMPDKLPETMIGASGDFAIEGIEFTAGRIGQWLEVGSAKEQVEGNIYLKDVRVRVATFSGVDHSHTAITAAIYEEIAGDHYSDGTDSSHYREMLLMNARQNVQIIDCDFVWDESGHFVWRSETQGVLVQNCYFGEAGQHSSVNFSCNGGIVEDFESDGVTTTANGDNLYMARAYLHDTQNGDKEGMTTDGHAGINYCGPAEMSEDGLSFTFPAGTEGFQAGRIHRTLSIATGTGAGQSRRIVSVKGTTVTIDKPFDVSPDETSCLTDNFMYANWYMTDIKVENTGMFQFYVAHQNVVVDNVTFERAAGLKLYANWSYKTTNLQWYTSLINNKFLEGNYYHFNGWMNYHYQVTEKNVNYGIGPAASQANKNETLPGYSFLYLQSNIEFPAMLGITVRDNELSDGSLLLVVNEVSDGAMTDIILDGNHFEDNDCGIYIHGSPALLLMQRNTYRHVKEPIKMTESWLNPFDETYYKANILPAINEELIGAGVRVRPDYPTTPANHGSPIETAPNLITVVCDCGDPTHTIQNRSYYHGSWWRWNEGDFRWEIGVDIFKAQLLEQANKAFGATEVVSGIERFWVYHVTEENRYYTLTGENHIVTVTCPKAQ